MSIKFKYLILVIWTVGWAESGLACDGYKLKVNQFKNCAGVDSVIKIDKNITIKLTKDCHIKIAGCLNNEAFSMAKAKFTIAKNGLTLLQTKEDLCDLMGNANKKTKSILSTFGIPSQCPIKKSQICSDENKQIDVHHLKRFFALALGGTIKIDVDIEHDKGRTCAKTFFELKK